MTKAPPLLLAVLLSACSPQVEGPVGPRPERPITVGGSLTIAIGPVATLDPQLATDPDSQLVVRTMCDQLVGFDPRTSQPVGGLAESWTITSGGRRLIVKLRKDLRFPNGEDLTADDVVFTLTRLASEDLASPAARLLENVSGFGFVHGDVDTDQDRLIAQLAGVRRIEGRSIEITLDRPNAEFFKVLGHPATTIVSRRAAQAEPSSIVCAGPYRRTGKPTQKDRIVLERNSKGRTLSAAYSRGGAGYADRIEFVSFPDRSAAFDAYLNGDRFDAVQVPESRLAEIAGSVDRVDVVTSQLEMIGLPTGRTPFDDPSVRRALSLALDRDRIAAAVFGGGRVPALGFVAPGIPGSSQCVEDAKADVETARALIGSAGADLTTVTARIYFNDEFDNARLVSEVADQWRVALGLRSELVPLGWDSFLSAGTSPRGFDGPFRYAWLPEYPSVERVIHPLFDTDSIGRDNLSRHSSPDLRASLRIAKRTTDDRGREIAYRKAQRVLCEESPAIPIVFDVKTFLVRSAKVRTAVGGLMDEVSAAPNLREWTVAEAR